MKCPHCNTNHRYQHTAQQCYQDVIISLNMRSIAKNQLSKQEVQIRETIKEYYFGLPMHPKFTVRVVQGFKGIKK